MDIRQGMQAVANQFYRLQQGYYKNDLQDQELIESTTQPFWQSMRLSKRRLQAKELTMDVDIREEQSKKLHRGNVYTYKDGANQVGYASREVVTQRSFYHRGKKIFGKKEHDISTIHLLKTEVDGENAACPNCGHEGKVSGFIDGCDYCGSKFTVKDFEPKICGFSLEENIQKKVTSTFLKTLVFLGISTVLLGIIAFVSGVIFMFYVTSAQETKGMFVSMFSLFASLDLVPVLMNTIFRLVFLYAILGGVLIFAVPGQIKGERIVKAVIPEFSSQDFFQHLEYKLRNIHLTDRAGEVSAFASFDLAPVVAGYKDVVDCHMRSLKYLAVRPTSTGYEMDVEVNLKLSVFNGKRIRIKYETVRLILSGKREILEKSTTAIREYKCPNCANSISLLEGGRCEYCDTQLDYENYGWVLQRYEKKWKWLHTYGWIQLLMLLLYVLVFVSCYQSSNAAENQALGVLNDMLGAEQAVVGFYDSVPQPEAFGLEAKLTDRVDEYVYRKCIYSSADGEALAEAYRKALLEKGLVEASEGATETSYNLYQQEEYAGEIGYVKLTVTYSSKQMIVEYNVAEFVGE